MEKEERNKYRQITDRTWQGIYSSPPQHKSTDRRILYEYLNIKAMSSSSLSSNENNYLWFFLYVHVLYLSSHFSDCMHLRLMAVSKLELRLHILFFSRDKCDYSNHFVRSVFVTYYVSNWRLHISSISLHSDMFTLYGLN